MRVRHWLVGISGVVVCLAAFTGGCSGSTTDSAADAGSGAVGVVLADASKDVGLDTNSTGSDDAGPEICQVDADLNTYAPVDASLADGATSVGKCLGCLQSSCPNQITACSGNCECQRASTEFIDCLASGDTYMNCGFALVTGLPSAAQGVGRSLGLCALGSCMNECAPNIDAASYFDGGLDANLGD